MPLKPAHQLAPEPDDAGVWRATGDDPQFLWTPAAEERAALLQPGGVRVRLTLTLLEGELVDPGVYIDWGDGFGDEAFARLQPGFGDQWTALAYARGPLCKRIRLDPSSKPCRFRLEGFTVEPLPATVAPATSPAARARLALRIALGPARAQARRVAARAGLLRRPAGRGVPRGGGPWRAVYQHGFDVARNLRSPEYAAPPLDEPAAAPDAPRVVAFHLPQFHPFPENDAWWGKGFTEWTNVAKAVPQFQGHYQPRLPADLGYYDLRLPEALAAQVDLARKGGVSAFCFHYYWFGGKRLLDRPLDLFRDSPELDLGFCLCWANENWTRRWDGAEDDILIAQRHSPEDDVAVFDDMARYLADPRYLRVEGRPLIILYRPDILPEAAATTERWRKRAREIGLGELHLLCTNAFGFRDYRRYGFDGLVEFPPHAIRTGEITEEIQPLHADFRGKVYDFPEVARSEIDRLHLETDPAVSPGVMPGWDNEARKPGAAHVFHDALPSTYHRWLSAALQTTARRAGPERGLVFVNAWNEWAEGAYLEPDRWFGHGYLQATRAALRPFAPKLSAEAPAIDAARQGFIRRRDAVVLLHLYYPELTDWFAERLARLADRLDVIVTVPEHWSEAQAAQLHGAFPQALILPVENRGRDVLPFITALREAQAHGWSTFCKLHSKRSPHLASGEADREGLVSGLIGGDAAGHALERLANDDKLGLLAPAASRRSLGERDVMLNNRAEAERLSALLRLRYGEQTAFPGGTMFWGRTAAFAPLLQADELGFEPEMGRIDGTVAHALERLMAAVAERSGFHAAFDL